MFVVLNSQAAQSYLERTMAAIRSMLTAGRITGNGYDQKPRMDEHAMLERPKLPSVVSIQKAYLWGAYLISIADQYSQIKISGC